MTSGHKLREAIQAKYTMDEAASALGMTRPTLYYKTNGDVDPGFVNEVKKKLPRVVLTDVFTPDSNVNEDTEPIGNDLAMRTIYSLAESNKQIAESNASLSRSNEELVIMIKSTVNGAPQTDATLSTKWTDLLELLAEIGTGKKRWLSKQEAVAELSKRFLIAPTGK